MTMTDEKFIELLRKIKEYCHDSYIGCLACPFNVVNAKNYNSCQFLEIAAELSCASNPANWNIDEVERIVKL